MALADCADREGRNAFPSVRTIAEHCLIDERTVQRALQELRDRGLIAVQEAAAYRKATTYRLFPAGAQAQALEPMKGDNASPMPEPMGDLLSPLVDPVKGDMKGDMKGDIGAAHIRSDPGDPGDPGNPPYPLPVGRGRVTKRELREAERIREAWGRSQGRSCLHDPRCASPDDCVLLIVDRRREERLEALARRAQRAS